MQVSLVPLEINGNHAFFRRRRLLRPEDPIAEDHMKPTMNGSICSDLQLAAEVQAAAFDRCTSMGQSRVRRVHFSNNADDPDSITVEVREIERISDPREMAQMYSNRDETERCQFNARQSTMKASIDYYELLADMKYMFLGPRGNANKKLNVLLDWNVSNDEHRGLESRLFHQWALEHEAWDCSAMEWSALLALTDCMVVYGTSKAVQDITRITNCGRFEAEHKRRGAE